MHDDDVCGGSGSALDSRRRLRVAVAGECRRGAGGGSRPVEQFERTRLRYYHGVARSRTHAPVTPTQSEQLSERLPEPPPRVLEATRLIKRVRIGPLFTAVNPDIAQPRFRAPSLHPQEQRAPHATPAEPLRHG